MPDARVDLGTAVYQADRLPTQPPRRLHRMHSVILCILFIENNVFKLNTLMHDNLHKASCVFIMPHFRDATIFYETNKLFMVGLQYSLFSISS